MLLPQLGDEFLDRAPARLPYDVRDEQQFHAPKVTPRRRRASRFAQQPFSSPSRTGLSWRPWPPEVHPELPHLDKA